MNFRNIMIMFLSVTAVSLVILIVFFSLFFENVDLTFDTRVPESAPMLEDGLAEDAKGEKKATQVAEQETDNGLFSFLNQDDGSDVGGDSGPIGRVTRSRVNVPPDTAPTPKKNRPLPGEDTAPVTGGPAPQEDPGDIYSSEPENEPSTPPPIPNEPAIEPRPSEPAEQQPVPRPVPRQPEPIPARRPAPAAPIRPVEPAPTLDAAPTPPPPATAPVPIPPLNTTQRVPAPGALVRWQ